MGRFDLLEDGSRGKTACRHVQPDPLAGQMRRPTGMEGTSLPKPGLNGCVRVVMAQSSSVLCPIDPDHSCVMFLARQDTARTLSRNGFGWGWGASRCRGKVTIEPVPKAWSAISDVADGPSERRSSG